MKLGLSPLLKIKTMGLIKQSDEGHIIFDPPQVTLLHEPLL
jgi:hypothetical protein